MMNNSVIPSISEVGLGSIWHHQPTTPRGPFIVATVLITVAVLGSYLFLRETPTKENVTLRCDRSAVIASRALQDYRGDDHKFRKNRKFAFQSCMDESLRTMHKPPN